MSFGSRLILSGIFIVVFIFAFASYLTTHSWPTTDELYPCLLVTALVGIFLATAPRH